MIKAGQRHIYARLAGSPDYPSEREDHGYENDSGSFWAGDAAAYHHSNAVSPWDVAFVFGIAAFFWPTLTVETLASLFAVWALLNGVLSILLSLADLAQRVGWWRHLGEGVLGLIVGLVTFFRSPITSLGLLYLVVIWAVVLGILEILIAFWTRTIVRESWLTFINGIFALLFGLVLLVQPETGAMASVRVIVLFALIPGTMQIARAVRIGQTTNPTVVA